MPIDASIPLQVQQINPMQSLSSVLGMANQVQGLKNAQLANAQGQNQLQQSDIALQEKQGVQGILKNIRPYQDSQGNIDFNRLMPDIMQVAPTTGSDVLKNIFDAQNAATGAKAAVVGLDNASRKVVGDALYAMKGQPDDVVQSTLQGLQSTFPALKPATEFIGRYILLPHKGDQQGLDAAIDRAGRFVQSAPTQQDMLTPQGVGVSNGQQSAVVSTKPGTTVPQGRPIPGTEQQQQLPPTTPTMVSGQPQYLGPQPTQKAGAAPPVAAGPAIGQTEGITGPVQANNAHFAKVMEEGSNAPNQIAQLQTIKQQIPTAIMGGGGAGDLLRGFSRVFGFASDAATANDVMAKNLAMLASQAGNTDAARTLGEMQSPNYHVTAKAAQEAADSLIGIAQKKQAATAYFAGTPTNSPEYTSKLVNWNRYADPRAFEFAAKSPEDQAATKAAMVKAGTWKTLQNNMLQLHKMGVEPQ